MALAAERGWEPPAYSTVHQVVAAQDPQLVSPLPTTGQTDFVGIV
ncbi:MAG: hypothetical protein ACP5P1_13515 [Acidimicrobiales bacterium]